MKKTKECPRCFGDGYEEEPSGFVDGQPEFDKCKACGGSGKRKNGQQQCRVKDCQAQGEPHDGYGFFVCDKCLAEFERLLEQKWQKWMKGYVRHQAN